MPDTSNKARRALRIAVTGGAGSGKSIVCKRFQTLGAFVVDLDRLSRQAVEPGTGGFQQVIERFGREVITEDGGLDRRRLREIIVADEKARRDLEAIVHPEVLRRMNDAMDKAEAAGAPLLVAEVPLLFEAGLERFFDQVVVVAAPEEARVRRLVERDNVAAEQAAALIGIQMPESEKRKRADFVIENSGRPGDIIGEVDRLFDRLAAKAEKDGESA
ncbi:MAG: dephospho-CoA kinase [Desulfobacterales bacterium]|nr:dephospho-CoA kinase [Desulfobacterales bacterium]